MTAARGRIENGAGDRIGSTWASRTRLLTFILVTLAIGVSGGAAWAYWLATTTAASSGASAATSVNAGATPTASVAGTTVTVSWSASTLANGTAVTGYLVKRYDATTLVAQTILSACTGTVTTTSCVESTVPQGSWKYTVTPVIGTNWQGAESAKSATATVDTVGPTNVLSLSSVTGGSFLSGTNLYYAGASAGSFKVTNALTDAVSGPASSQTAALTGTSTGWTHTPSTVSTPTGGPYVSSLFSWTAGTTTGPGEVVTGRDVNGNATPTSLTLVNDNTAPSAGTVSYANGLTGGASVSVSFTTGTDGGSGIGTRLLQRAAAPATMAGACGTYGSFATVTGGTNPTSPVTDTVAFGFCYEYQYVVSDNVGNLTTATNANVARAPYGAIYSLNENTGTSANDSTGMGHTGTLQTGTGWTTGRFGASGVSVNGTTGFVDIAQPVIDTSKSYSVSLWVKLNAVTGSNQTFAAIEGTTISPFYLQLEGANFKFTERNSDANGSTITQVIGPVAVVGEWYHLVGVYDQSAGTIQLYVNGISQGTTAFTSGWQATGHTTIGRAKFNSLPVDFTTGAIDEVGFYDRALTAAEVVTLRGPFGAYWAFDAGSGTTAVDSTGNTNTGTLQAAAGWTAGKVGANALSLNGTSTSYVDIPTPVIDSSQSYTVATWVKLNSLTGVQTFASVDGANISPFYLQSQAGVFFFVQRASDSTGAAVKQVGGLTATVGAWYHVVGVYDKAANTIQLYVNGVSQGTLTAGTVWTAWGHTTVGRAKFSGVSTDFVNGALDETHFYDRALSASEISALAGSYSTVINGTTGLVNYWRLGEASGTSAVDSKSANNGTYNNANASTPWLAQTGVITNDANTAVTFDGVDDYIIAPRQIQDDFSIEFWFKSTQNFVNTCTLWWNGAGMFDSQTNGISADFGVSLCQGKVIAGTGGGASGSDTSIISPLTYNDGNWHQVVFTRTKATGVYTLYLDGASVGTTTGAAISLTANANIIIGRLASSTNNFAGTIDEVSTYSSVLSAATIAAHYASAR